MCRTGPCGIRLPLGNRAPLPYHETLGPCLMVHSTRTPADRPSGASGRGKQQPPPPQQWWPHAWQKNWQKRSPKQSAAVNNGCTHVSVNSRHIPAKPERSGSRYATAAKRTGASFFAIQVKPNSTAIPSDSHMVPHILFGKPKCLFGLDKFALCFGASIETPNSPVKLALINFSHDFPSFLETTTRR